MIHKTINHYHAQEFFPVFDNESTDKIYEFQSKTKTLINNDYGRKMGARKKFGFFCMLCFAFPCPRKAMIFVKEQKIMDKLLCYSHLFSDR